MAAVTQTFTTPLYAQPPITDIAQLKGQKVGVSRIGSISHLTALAIFQRAKIGDVTLIQTGGIPESMAALSSGNMSRCLRAFCSRRKAFVNWLASNLQGSTGPFRLTRGSLTNWARQDRKEVLWQP